MINNQIFTEIKLYFFGKKNPRQISPHISTVYHISILCLWIIVKYFWAHIICWNHQLKGGGYGIPCSQVRVRSKDFYRKLLELFHKDKSNNKKKSIIHIICVKNVSSGSVLLMVASKTQLCSVRWSRNKMIPFRKIKFASSKVVYYSIGSKYLITFSDKQTSNFMSHYN